MEDFKRFFIKAFAITFGILVAYALFVFIVSHV